MSPVGCGSRRQTASLEECRLSTPSLLGTCLPLPSPLPLCCCGTPCRARASSYWGQNICEPVGPSVLFPHPQSRPHRLVLPSLPRAPLPHLLPVSPSFGPLKAGIGNVTPHSRGTSVQLYCQMADSEDSDHFCLVPPGRPVSAQNSWWSGQGPQTKLGWLPSHSVDQSLPLRRLCWVEPNINSSQEREWRKSFWRMGSIRVSTSQAGWAPGLRSSLAPPPISTGAWVGCCPFSRPQIPLPYNKEERTEFQRLCQGQMVLVTVSWTSSPHVGWLCTGPRGCVSSQGLQTMCRCGPCPLLA